MRYLFNLGEPGAYENYKHVLAKALLLGIELLVAADVVRTVALEPTLNNAQSQAARRRPHLSKLVDGRRA